MVIEGEVSFPRGGSGGGDGGGSGGRTEQDGNDPTKQHHGHNDKKRKGETGNNPASSLSSSSFKQDFLFGTKSISSQSNSHKKLKKGSEKDSSMALTTSTTSKHSLLPLGGGGVVLSNKQHHHAKGGSESHHHGASSPVIEAFGFAKLAKGTKVLACVRHVHEEYALVSLPNMLTAYLLPSSSSASSVASTTTATIPLVRQLHIGQTLAVVVQKVVTETLKGGNQQHQQRRIQVTALPQAVNPKELLFSANDRNVVDDGNVAASSMATANRLARDQIPVRGQILSVEDHGCVVDVGFGKRGFLAFDKVQSKDYIVLEDDEDVKDDDTTKEENGDESRVKVRMDRRPILQRGRLNDFLVLAPSLAPSSTLANEKQSKGRRSSKKDSIYDQKAAVLSLTLPSGLMRAKTTVANTSAAATNDRSTSNKNKERSTSPLSLASITPGWLVHAKIEAMATNGLCVSFFGNVFRGAIELNHLGATVVPTSKDPVLAHSEWKQLFSKHQHFPARIVAVDVATKLVRLSISPSVLMLDSVPESLNGFPSVGTVIEDCTVVRVDPGIGAVLALPGEFERDQDDNGAYLPKSLKKSSDLFLNAAFEKACQVRRVYVHISKAIDESDDNASSAALFNKEFAPSTKHSVRILNTSHWMEGMASGGCAPSILEAHVLTHADLVPGKVYKQAPISAHTPGGSILVQLGEGRKGKQRKSAAMQQQSGVAGLIPLTQLFDTNASSAAGGSGYRDRIIKTKYAVDAKVDVRVLWVDPLRKKCLLTAKKTLVQAHESHIITDYRDVSVGQIAVGYVSRVDDQGLSVTFCNKVYGRVTGRSLGSDLGVENHKENYSVGDVVTCRVVKLKKIAKHGRSSMEDDDDMDVDDDDEVGDMNTKPPREYWELTLSLKVEQGNGESEESAIDVRNPCQVSVRPGAILPPKSMKIMDLVGGRSKEKGGFIPGYAVVSIKSKYVMTDDSLAPGKMLQTIECKLPFDQLMDSYDPAVVLAMESLDKMAGNLLEVGKKINQKGIVLSDPHKSNVDYSSGIGRMPTVSLRKDFIQATEDWTKTGKEPSEDTIIVPTPKTPLFVGAKLLGFVAQVDPRHGSFVRFLDGMTGLIPKKHRGLALHLYDTVATRVTAIDDTRSPNRILLEATLEEKSSSYTENPALNFKVGDKIETATISKIGFFEASLNVFGNESTASSAIFTLHVSNKDASIYTINQRTRPLPKNPPSGGKPAITKHHPFYCLKSGQQMTGLTIVRVQKSKKSVRVYVTDKKQLDADSTKLECPAHTTQLKAGAKATAVVVGVGKKNGGLHVQISPTVSGFLPALELSRNVDILNDLESNIPLGAVLECRVLNQKEWYKTRSKCPLGSQYQKRLERKRQEDMSKGDALFLSILACEDMSSNKIPGPTAGALMIARINRFLPAAFAPSVMLDLRGGHVGRCCITEFAEPDEWQNMPLGRLQQTGRTARSSRNEDAMETDDGANSEEGSDNASSDDPFVDGEYIECRTLTLSQNETLAEVSFRPSRINGDIDDDPPPESGEVVQGYVIQTNKNGCFVRLSRTTEGRATLKQLCDGFLQNPESSFPMGRLVAGKVTEVRPVTKKGKHAVDSVRTQVDLDMRESTLLEEQENRLTFENVRVGEKYKGSVQRIEDYGVFVQLENSNVSGLVHLSECSDNFVKNLDALFDPGDLVKVLVLRKDDDKKQLGFSMKASHFEGDDDSDDSSIESNMVDVMDDDSESMEEEHTAMEGVVRDVIDESDDDNDSDDENFVAKLVRKMDAENESKPQESASFDESASDDDSLAADSSEGDSDEDESHVGTKVAQSGLDTDVGFDWGDGADKQPSDNHLKGDASDDDSDSSDSDSDSDEDDDGHGTENEKPKSRKSRKRRTERRREEQEISRREMALADGTADANPETAGDFERLLAGSPNNSELWIRYMAFYLSLADIAAARNVASKALDRIEFLQEREKLNVWTALLTLEHKYGNEETFQVAVDRACNQNNPKQVYLRACEILEKDLEQVSFEAAAVARADASFSTMCRKHKSKKKVWLAHMQYLLRQRRHQEAHSLMKRALLSLPSHKHAETMSRFAQLEFELGSPERARTLFDGLILKYPKRLDLFFVYVDKECKHGKIEHARTLLEAKVAERKFSDHKMKSLFKKWYRMEEEHGTDESREHVKDSARSYVQQSKE